MRDLWPRSLRGRLLAGSTALVIITVVLTGVAIDFVLRRFIQGQIDGRLDGQILAVADALRTAPSGMLRLERIVDGPPFERPLSGWYWEVLAPEPLLRSASLGGETFLVRSDPVDERPKPVAATGVGPRGEALRVRVQVVHAADMTLMVAVSAPLEALEGPRREALTPLALLLVALAAMMLGGVVLQVRFGLLPLTTLRRELSEIRNGRLDRLCAEQPSEIAPVVAELNILLAQNATNLERARRHVTNLAHGLKTPLATLALALERPSADTAATLMPLVSLMDRRIRHHLARARTAAQGGPERSSVALASRVTDHVEAFTKLYAEKGLAFVIDVEPTLVVACDAQDVDEMLGNLLDNACRFARSRIEIKAAQLLKRAVISIEDDGPGLTIDQAAEVLQRGRRLDESTPGHGFGLPITQELAELYGGSLALWDVPSGGLRATVTLPAS